MDAHQRDPLAVDQMTVQAQPVGHLPGSKERRSEKLLVDEPHQDQVIASLTGGPIVVARTRLTDQLTLTGRGDLRVIGLNQNPLTLRGAWLLFISQ